MKTTLFFFVLCLAPLALTGCNLLDGLYESDHPDEVVLEVHLQDYFGTAVQVLVDERVVFDGEVEGGHFSGPAEVIELEIAAGNHYLTVTIDGTLEEQTTFSTTNIQVIGVRYLPEEARVQFAFFSEQPLYL